MFAGFRAFKASVRLRLLLLVHWNQKAGLTRLHRAGLYEGTLLYLKPRGNKSLKALEVAQEGHGSTIFRSSGKPLNPKA